MKRMKMLAVALVTLPLLALALINPSAVPAAAAPQDFDAAAVFKAKCAMCHGQKAEKKFDATKADEALAATVLKGKDDVTPKMPSYEAKGVTAEQAKALVTQMKSLKQ
jgi:mono/diheme cytochrome c family protein